ncbi:MAG: hypothetical protein ACLR8P_06550 [Clostridium fessum]
MGCVVNGPGEAKEADLGSSRRYRRGTSDTQGRDCEKIAGE